MVIGDNCFFNNDCSLNAHKSIEIGTDCLFGENVKIYDHNHIFKDTRMRIAKQGYKVDNVVIGSNCWICSNVVILKGVKIGDNCIIGAGCIIKKDVPEGTIVKNESNINYIKLK
mgnify:CR=1 FL=1